MSRRPPRFYFSLRSPYSWLAWHDLTHHWPDVAQAMQWRPFWEPDAASEQALREAGGKFVYTPMSKEKHLYVLQDVRRLATQRGLTVAWPVDDEPRWEVPHLAYLVAESQGRGHEFIAAAHTARWQRGQNICDPDVVADLAEMLGMDLIQARNAADDPQVQERALQCLLDLHKDGVFGVPYFIRGYERYWGVDRLAAFATAVRESLVPVREPEPEQAVRALAAAGHRTTDWGHAGGCG